MRRRIAAGNVEGASRLYVESCSSIGRPLQSIVLKSNALFMVLLAYSSPCQGMKSKLVERLLRCRRQGMSIVVEEDIQANSELAKSQWL